MIVIDVGNPFFKSDTKQEDLDRYYEIERLVIPSQSIVSVHIMTDKVVIERKTGTKKHKYPDGVTFQWLIDKINDIKTSKKTNEFDSIIKSFKLVRKKDGKVYVTKEGTLKGVWFETSDNMMEITITNATYLFNQNAEFAAEIRNLLNVTMQERDVIERMIDKMNSI